MRTFILSMLVGLVGCDHQFPPVTEDAGPEAPAPDAVPSEARVDTQGTEAPLQPDAGPEAMMTMSPDASPMEAAVMPDATPDMEHVPCPACSIPDPKVWYACIDNCGGEPQCCCSIRNRCEMRLRATDCCTR